MGQVTSLFAHKMVEAAGSGLDRDALLCTVGLDSDSPIDPRMMINDIAYYAFLERIAQDTDVIDLPLKVAQLLTPDDYGALGLAWKSAPTLRGSFARVDRYARLWTSVVEYELRDVERGMLFVLHRAGPRRLGLRLSNEATLASAVSISRQVTPVAFSPLEVHFKHAAPKTVAYHRAYFGCPLYFSSELDALLIAPEALDQPNKLGDDAITQFLLSHLDKELAAVEQPWGLEAQTKDAIARALSEGFPKMAEIARGLGMSVRTFHRRLAAHGLSFQAVAEATRRELAENLLRDGQHSLAEIAFLTGFSEQSAFTRAFKRWAGHTPASYRKAHANA